MTSMAVGDNTIVIARGLCFDHYSNSHHSIVEIPYNPKLHENDYISDLTISADGQYLALITSVSKQLIVYDLSVSEKTKSFLIPRSASKLRFTVNNEQILVADKSGDVLLYNINNEDNGTKLLGHLSLLLDILQTKDGKFIITCDRDEKIKVSCYPNTYNIQTYCLGHKEFVNHLELLPHDEKILTSTSGDGYVNFWNYVNGKLLYSINTYLDVNDDQLKENFTKFMDNEGIEVNTLPIVHYTITQLNENSSIIAVVVHTYNKVLIYNLQTVNDTFTHTLIDTLKMDATPAAIQFYNSSLFVYNDIDCNVSVFKICKNDNDISLKFNGKTNMFESKIINSGVKEYSHDLIKVLYKRKFDNVQEYQERKKQRLEKSTK